MSKKAGIIVLLSIIVLEIIALALLIFNEGFSHVSRIRREKEYIIHEEEKIPREELTSFLIADDKFFLFFDYTGLVNVYDLDGNYLYGIQFATGNNGEGNITYVDVDNCFYIDSRSGVIFAFDGTTLVRAFTYVEDGNAFDRIQIYMTRNKNHSVDGIEYYYGKTENQIFTNNIEGKPYTIIDMPQKSDLVYPVGLVILLSIIGFCAFLQNKPIPFDISRF